MQPVTPRNDRQVVKHRKNARRADSVPLRMCVVSRERVRQTQMVRYALSPDGVVTPDVAGKLPGRGVWALASRDIVEQAIKTRAFARSFKQDVSVNDDLADLVESLLLRRCQSQLSLAKKAGALIIGFDQVCAELPKRSPGWLLTATNCAEDSRKKVHSLANRLYENLNIAGALSDIELGQGVGRASFVYGLMQKGPFAKRWGAEYKRLTGFRFAPEENWRPRKGN